MNVNNVCQLEVEKPLYKTLFILNLQFLRSIFLNESLKRYNMEHFSLCVNASPNFDFKRSASICTYKFNWEITNTDINIIFGLNTQIKLLNSHKTPFDCLEIKHLKILFLQGSVETL